MTAGRKAKPTALKLIQGTYRSDRANPNEPKPKAGIPPCPKFLEGDARKQYRKTAKKLLKIRLMTGLDDKVLSMLCQAWVECFEAPDQVKKAASCTNRLRIARISDHGICGCSSSISSGILFAASRMTIKFNSTALIVFISDLKASKSIPCAKVSI